MTGMTTFKILKRFLKGCVNPTKSFWGRPECEHLGFIINRKGLKPQPKKIDAIRQLKPPKTRKDLRSLVGLCNFYRDLFPRRSHLLAPLTEMSSKDKKFKWTEEMQTAFERIKKEFSRNVLLAYPNFNKHFDIHTDASDVQLGSVISQDGKPIAFYSRKLSPAQRNYTVAEKELLSIVETFKEFRTILLGQKLKVYTDHLNLLCKAHANQRVTRWRLLLEEYGPELIYLPGKKNVVADALSRLERSVENESTLDTTEALKEAQRIHLGKTVDEDIDSYYMQCFATHLCESRKETTKVNWDDMSDEHVAECYADDMDEAVDEFFPLDYEIIQEQQRKDYALQKQLKANTFITSTFRCGGEKSDRAVQLVTDKQGKIVVPESLQARLLEWYHTFLLHPGQDRTESTIRQHFYWDSLRDDVRKEIKFCETCQKNKRTRKKYGHLPPKEPEVEPWDTLCVDLIGPYTIHRNSTATTKAGRTKRNKKKETLILKAVTMIDPATGWFEIAQYDDKRAISVAEIIEQQWLNRYPWPNKIRMDRGKEFVGNEFKQMVKKDYGIKTKFITTRNPQANAIIERVHQVIANLVRTFNLEEECMDEDDPWAGILTSAAFAIRSTFHTTLKATPGQLVFGRDMIMNISHEADWQQIKANKLKKILSNNKRENKKRTPHEYKEGDKVLLEKEANKYERNNDGPFTITKVNKNGTVRLQMGAISDLVNTRRITPYYERK